MMDERMHKIWRYLDQISDASRNARELMQQIWNEQPSRFRDGQRIRHRHGGQQGTVVGTGVRRDGDSYESCLMVNEWEPV